MKKTPRITSRHALATLDCLEATYPDAHCVRNMPGRMMNIDLRVFTAEVEVLDWFGVVQECAAFEYDFAYVLAGDCCWFVVLGSYD